MAQVLQGVVSSVDRDKTITVSVTTRESHPIYRKKYTRTHKYTAHDEQNQAHLGDTVEIIECRPISKTKHFTLNKVINRTQETIELIEDLPQGDQS